MVRSGPDWKLNFESFDKCSSDFYYFLKRVDSLSLCIFHFIQTREKQRVTDEKGIPESAWVGTVYETYENLLYVPLYVPIADEKK